MTNSKKESSIYETFIYYWYIIQESSMVSLFCVIEFLLLPLYLAALLTNSDALAELTLTIKLKITDFIQKIEEEK